MPAQFTEATRLRSWLDLVAAQAERGIIPAGDETVGKRA
jgi:hypothetical protein